MKFTATIALAILLFATSQGLSIFERTFQILHREPPPPTPESRLNIENQWIEQKLDHLNQSDTRIWKMRYLANSQFFEKGGPIFIFVGGEWEISSGYLLGGHMYDMAKEHAGYLFYTEHRYYGQSRPTKDLETMNLKYLNVKQALADLAHFIRTTKSNTTGLENSKVILTGGSYAGAMVTWFKRLYPDLIVGAWASSAPLYAKPDFFEYKEVTGKSIKLVGGEACYNRIRNGIVEMENMISNNQTAEVLSLINICNNFNTCNDLDVWSLFSQISNIFAGVVQSHTNRKIEKACDQIMQGKDDLTGLSNFILSFTLGSRCTDTSYKSVVSYIKNSTHHNGVYRQWFYQTCNEYGWYHTSGSTAQPFGTKFPLALQISQCHDIFGDQFTNETIHKNTGDTNTLFGGLNPEVKNVYMTHGQLDPWHAMGITDEKKATVIPMHSHCNDFGSINSADSAEMRASKEKIAELVRDWMKT